MDLLPRRDIAHDEPLGCQIGPFKFGFVRQRVIIGQHHENLFAPHMLRLTAIPGRRSGYERNIQTKFTDRSDVLRGIAIKDVDLHIRVTLPEITQQIEQES